MKEQAIKGLAELRQAGAELETKETMKKPEGPYSGLRNREAEEAMKWYWETQGRCPKCAAAGFHGWLIIDELGPVCINCAWMPGGPVQVKCYR